MDYSFPSFSQIFRFSIFCAEGTFGVGEVASAYYGQLLETQRQESPAVEAAHPTISGQFSQHFEDWSVAESLLNCRSVVLRFQRWKRTGNSFKALPKRCAALHDARNCPRFRPRFPLGWKSSKNFHCGTVPANGPSTAA